MDLTRTHALGARMHGAARPVGGRHRAWLRAIPIFALLLLALIMVAHVQSVSALDSAEVHEVPGGPSRPLPHFDHIIVVVEENHSFEDITGASDAPYLHTLMGQGAVFTRSYAVAHPSTPNYLALFAGSTFGVTSDDCPQVLSGPNLATELMSHQLSFAAYSEALPFPGDTRCAAGHVPDHPHVPLYGRKHDPWADFATVPTEVNQPFSSFPSDFRQLPTVAFVIPSQIDNMHSGSIAAADTWLETHLGAYATWAMQHNSLLIITWDEDDRTSNNHILTLFVGAHIQPGDYGESIDHYDVLRTIEALCGVSYTNAAASASTIADIWQG